MHARFDYRSSKADNLGNDLRSSSVKSGLVSLTWRMEDGKNLTSEDDNACVSIGYNTEH